MSSSKTPRNIEEKLTDRNKIRKKFHKIWDKIFQKTSNLEKINHKKVKKELQKLVIYDALDGTRSTLTKTFKKTNPGIEGGLFAIKLIHIFNSLKGKSCIIMVHTSYNRLRGKKEFRKILKNIKTGGKIIERFAEKKDIACHCLYINNKYEQKKLLDRINKKTRKKTKNCLPIYFLFDYNEKWISTNKGRKIIEKLPDIDVHIRHTKLQFSGGWIPGKMSRSVFLYSQNGAKLSNWNNKELITLIALALLAKILNKGEALLKKYKNQQEIKKRHQQREIKLFNQKVKLRQKPKKLCIFGSPKGIYQYYF
ncbi:MAG: hypothetical protein V5A68_08275 [Candidatus Thermoplasmatota archaeon]